MSTKIKPARAQRKFAYHFHAVHQLDGVKTRHASSLLVTDERIDSHGNYQALQNDVAMHMGLDSTEGLQITSLTYLHEVQ